MPATVTHAYFAKDVYDVLPGDIKSRLNCSRVKTFGQSVDSLYFYNLFSIMPGKNIRAFAGYFHDNNSYDFFYNLINYIKDNDLSNDMDVCSYLVGMISHYVLDSTVHPYIFYKTGKFDKKKPSTYKYRNIHEFMEVFIDNDMIRRRENVNPYTFRLDKFCFNTNNFSSDLIKTIDYTFYETFGIKHISPVYYKSLKQMKRILFLFRRDPYGYKKNFYKFIDTFTSKKAFRFEAVSYHYPLRDRHNFLNNNHNMWRNPIDYNLTSEESFIDLYLKAIKTCKILVCASFDYINGKDIELDKIFTNDSYITGLNCDIKKELKYFEF